MKPDMAYVPRTSTVAAVYVKSFRTQPVPPPNCVHNRTYTGLPSTGNPLTVADRFVPCPWLYTLKLPDPVVPTDSEYCSAPAPALHLNVVSAPGNAVPGTGVIRAASPLPPLNAAAIVSHSETARVPVQMNVWAEISLVVMKAIWASSVNALPAPTPKSLSS